MKKIINVCLAFCVFSASEFVTASEMQHYNFELFGGLYSSELPRLDEEEIIGARFGYRIHDHMGMHVNLTYRQGEVDLSDSTFSDVTLDWRATAVDFALVWHPKIGGTLEPSFYAGPGYASIRGDGSAVLPNGDAIYSDNNTFGDTLTFNVGLGSAIRLTDTVYLRIGTRARWYEARESDDIDTEATLAIGFKIH